MQNTNDITALGASDHFAMRGKYKNPYARGTQEYNDYERGWMQALKRSSTSPSDNSGSSASRQVAAKLEINAYALAKGRAGPKK